MKQLQNGKRNLEFTCLIVHILGSTPPYFAKGFLSHIKIFICFSKATLSEALPNASTHMKPLDVFKSQITIPIKKCF